MPTGHYKDKNRTVDKCTNPTCIEYGLDQPISQFSWQNKTKGERHSWCKRCDSTYFKNPKIKEHQEQYQKQYRRTAEGKLANRKSRQKNRLSYNEYQRNYRNNNILAKIAHNLRRRLTNAIKNTQKKGSFVRDLGITIGEYKLYLESQFQPGMSWTNYGYGPGKWQIDHLIPLVAFNLQNRSEFLEACHWTNTQPIWYKEHLKKTASERLNNKRDSVLLN